MFLQRKGIDSNKRIDELEIRIEKLEAILREKNEKEINGTKTKGNRTSGDRFGNRVHRKRNDNRKA